MYQPAQTKGD